MVSRQGSTDVTKVPSSLLHHEDLPNKICVETFGFVTCVSFLEKKKKKKGSVIYAMMTCVYSYVNINVVTL